MKTIKGEKYIYLASAYALAKGGSCEVGYDNGFKGGYLYWRRFYIQNYKDKELLIEKKSSQNGADFSRVFEVKHYSDKRPDFIDYINESGENYAKRWEH